MGYYQEYAAKQRTIGATLKCVRRECPHVVIRWNPEVGEFRITYRGINQFRQEDVASYTNDAEDAIGTARLFEAGYAVFLQNERFLGHLS